MVGQWRVSLRLQPVLEDQRHVGTVLKFPQAAVVAGLRSRLAAGTVISAESIHVFIYPATAEAAAEAEQAARDVLAQRDIGAYVRRERWVPATGEWQDVHGQAPSRAVAERLNADAGASRLHRILPVPVALVRSMAKAVTDGVFP
jgi:hypothetical protein